MFVGASTDVGGDASVENAVRAVGHDVDPAAGHSRLTGRSDWIFLEPPHLAAKTPVYEGWNSLDFLGFSRPNRDLSMGCAGFSAEIFS